MNNSPETCDQRAADMWSYTMILWELSTREVPFAEMSPMEMGMKVCALISIILYFLSGTLPSCFHDITKTTRCFYKKLVLKN